MLSLKFEAGAGEDVRDCIDELVAAANRLDVIAEAKLNDVLVMVKPGADPLDIWRKWKEEGDSDRPHKIIYGQPVPPLRDRQNTF